jgi:twitching motility protein PilT
MARGDLPAYSLNSMKNATLETSSDLFHTVDSGEATRHGVSKRLRAMPRPPRICETLANAAPVILSGVERIQFLANALREATEQQRLVMRLHVEQLACHMIHLGASDMDAGGPASNDYVWYRVGGVKEPAVALGAILPAQMDVLALNLLSDPQLDQLLNEYAVDFSFKVQGEGLTRPRRFRVTMYFDEDNIAVNMRSIKEDVRPLDALGLHPSIRQGMLFSNIRDGLTLITGVTGSGKSSTLDSIIDANNQIVSGHVVVIGNPIEYMHQSKKCIVRHREIGKGVASFKDGMVQAMRQDPDMIVIGEMRDAATISATMEAADSGHRVYSTLHTRSAVESIDRIIAEYPTEEQTRVRNRLADVLRCVISQKLCPKIGGGLVLAKEVLWLTPSVQAAIKNGNTGEIYQMIWEGSSIGQITIEQDLLLLVRRGLITPETAFSFENNNKRLKQLF